MTSSSSPENSNEAIPQEPPLPDGILNALDDAVNESVPWVIDNLLSEGEQMLVFGAPKVGKSQFALQMAMCLAMGEPFLNWQVTKRRRVLYLNFEMGKRIFMLRIARHFSRLLEQKNMRECAESGQEYVCDADPWHHLEDEVPPGGELREEVNGNIKDHLFFSSDFKSLHGDHVPGCADSPEKGKQPDPKSDAAAAQKLLVRHWQSVIEAIKPDLVIFDTLSKTHSINESDNSEIQQVLLRIRQICSIPLSANGESQSERHQPLARKYIAHVIVHHARKLPGESFKGGGGFNLDNIRGGSAIRAEADLICGIFSTSPKVTTTHEATNRVISIEARNLAPSEQRVNFEKFAFCHPRQRTPEKEESRNDEVIDFVRLAFVQSKMRGLAIATMEAKVSDGLIKSGREKEFTPRGLKDMLKSLANQTGSNFEIRVKRGAEEETAKFPHERDVGKILYWIKDGSAWLDQQPLKAAIDTHVPIAVRKGKKT